jgi:hypothetical protein
MTGLKTIKVDRQGRGAFLLNVKVSGTWSCSDWREGSLNCRIELESGNHGGRGSAKSLGSGKGLGIRRGSSLDALADVLSVL